MNGVTLRLRSSPGSEAVINFHMSISRLKGNLLLEVCQQAMDMEVPVRKYSHCRQCTRIVEKWTARLMWTRAGRARMLGRRRSAFVRGVSAYHFSIDLHRRIELSIVFREPLNLLAQRSHEFSELQFLLKRFSNLVSFQNSGMSLHEKSPS